jgi:hypothetical protein
VVYFGTSTTVQRMAAAGGAPIVVANDLRNGLPRAMALDGARLAYLDGENGFTQVVDLAGGQVAACVPWYDDVSKAVSCQPVGGGSPALNVATIFFGGGLLLWADGSSLKYATDGTSPVLTRQIVSLDGPISGVAARDAQAFLSVSIPDPPSGMIAKVTPNLNAVPVTIARSGHGATAIAVDDAHVYWATDDCAIMRTTQ